MQNKIREKLGLDFYEASKIFTPYIGSCSLEWEIKGTTQDCVKQSDFNLYDANWFMQKYRCTLLLKHISNIIAEDAIFIAKTVYKDPKFLTFESIGKTIAKQYLVGEDELNIKSFQYLQSKGYALPYIDFTIEQLIDVEIYRII